MVNDTKSPLAVEINRSEPKLQQAPQLQLAPQSRRLFPKRVFIMIGSIFLAGLLGLLTMQLTSPTDISGHWTGENWQHVSLASVDEVSDWYSGTFVDSAGRRGALRLEWSRLQQRYNGRWKVGEAEAGEITLRAGENGTLRGAVSVDPESQLEPNVPRLLEFAWQPASKEAQQHFETQSSEYQTKSQGTGRQVGRSAIVKSPTRGVLVRIADGIKLNARVKEGDLIAEIEQFESTSTLERQQQELSALQRKCEVASSKIFASEKDLDAAKQICAAIEAQIKNLESAKQKNAEAIKAGLEQQATELQAQSNLDTAIVALKKAEADSVKVETERQLAEKERLELMQEIGELQIKLQDLARLQILAPVAGKITDLAMLRQSVKEGDMIFEVTPDPAQPSEAPESQKSATATPAPTPSHSPVAEPKLSSSLQSLSAFGPASELAKRMRVAKEKIAQKASYLESHKRDLAAIEEKLSSVREKQSQASDDSSPKQKQLAQQLESMENQKKLTVSMIDELTAESKIANAELAEAESEQNTIVEILHTQLLAAHRQLQLQEESRKRVGINHNRGISSTNELSQAEHAVTVAESEVRQLELLLKFYDSIGRDKGE